MFGFSTRLFADAIEEARSGPREGVISSGATRLQETTSGVAPQVWPALLSQGLYVFDRIFVDGLAVNGTARLPRFAGEILRPLYNGVLQGYGASMAGGVALVLAWIVWVWMRGGV